MTIADELRRRRCTRNYRPVGPPGAPVALWCDDRLIGDVGKGRPMPSAAYAWLRTAGRTAWPTEAHRRAALVHGPGQPRFAGRGPVRVGRIIQYARTILATAWPDLREIAPAIDTAPATLTPVEGLGAIAVAAEAMAPDGGFERVNDTPPDGWSARFARDLGEVFTGWQPDDDLRQRLWSGTLALWRRHIRERAVALVTVVWCACRPDAGDVATARAAEWWRGDAAARCRHDLLRAQARIVGQQTRRPPHQPDLPFEEVDRGVV